MPTPRVAIVILNWNGEKFLDQFLPSVLKTDYPNYELIIADNGSTDGSIAFLKKNYPQIRVIQNGSNVGFATGYNLALKQVDAEYYAILNSDVEVSSDWLTPMLSLMDKDVRIAACQPKLLSYHNRNVFEYAGAAGGWIDQYGYPFSRGRLFEVCEEDKGQYDNEEPIFWASGAALFIRSKIYHDMNGFDDYFFAHQEEIDLCWRIQLAGHKVYSCPGSVVYHVGGGTLPRGNARKTYLNFRNNHIMMAKNYPWSMKIWIIPVRMGLDAISAWKSLLGGDLSYFMAIVRAHIGFLNWWLFRKKSSGVKPAAKIKLNGYIRKNIVWLHFIKKKQTFLEIVGEGH